MLEQHPEIARGTPGVIGAVSAMLWLKDSCIRKTAAVIAGSATSYYGTDFALTMFGALDRNLMSFLIGLFGMAVAAKIYETIEHFPIKDMLERVLTRKGA